MCRPFPRIGEGRGRAGLPDRGLAIRCGAAYIAIDRHQLDDRRPYVYKTDDYGKTWTDIGKGLPPDVPARVVRENPNLRGFLVLGTDAALWYARTAARSWKP